MFFLKKIVNWLHAWFEYFPHVIHPCNIKDSLAVKINVTIVTKQKHLPQISVQELHNDMILPTSEGGFGWNNS